MSSGQPETPSIPPYTYRPDIDGLRAIAVLAVILFHFNAAWLPGGFVGVDVFFVISGYLITGLILKDLNQNTFSLTEFYRRRVKRIGPAMLAVIAATLLAAHFIVHPRDLEELSVAAFAALLFLPNVHATFEVDQGYFAEAAEVQPLLHLWSLGVEEQFYLLWPLLLLAVPAMRLKPIFWFLVALVGIGGATLVGELTLDSYPKFAYYMIPSRAGQLLLGGLCAYWAIVGHGWLKQKWVGALTLPGLLLVFGSYFWLTAAGGYPGMSSLPVTVGAAMVILGGIYHQGWVSQVLGSKLLVGIGLMSYSLYLWHWPILALARYREQTLSPSLMVALALVIALVSWASYRFIEQPFRRSRRPFKSLVVRQWVWPSTVIVAVCILLNTTQGLGLYAFDSEFKRQYEAIGGDQKSASHAPYVCQHAEVTQAEMVDPTCVVNSSQEPDILLWGDSNAGHYVGALKALAEQMGFGFRNINHSACPPLIENAELYTSEKWEAHCKQAARFVANNIDQYSTLILSASWDTAMNRGDDFGQALKETLTHFIQEGKRVYVIGRIPRLNSDFRNCYIKKLKGVKCDDDKSMAIEKASKVNLKVRAIAQQAGAHYFDFNELICPQRMCSPYIEGDFAYYDRGHLSSVGSEALGELAAKSTYVRNALRALQGVHREYVGRESKGAAGEPTIEWRIENALDYLLTEDFEAFLDPHRYLKIVDDNPKTYVNVPIGLLESIPYFRVPDGKRLAIKFSIKEASNYPMFRLYVNKRDEGPEYDFVYNASSSVVTGKKDAEKASWQLDTEGSSTTLTIITDPLSDVFSLELRLYGGAVPESGVGYSKVAQGHVLIDSISLGTL